MLTNPDGSPFTLDDLAASDREDQVRYRADEFRRAALHEVNNRLPREGGPVWLALPGDGIEDVTDLDVQAVQAVTGRDPRQYNDKGQPRRANVALLRAALRRWALRPQATLAWEAT